VAIPTTAAARVDLFGSRVQCSGGFPDTYVLDYSLPSAPPPPGFMSRKEFIGRKLSCVQGHLANYISLYACITRFFFFFGTHAMHAFSYQPLHVLRPSTNNDKVRKKCWCFLSLSGFPFFFSIHTVLRGSFKKNYLPKSIMQRCFARILSLSLTLSRSVSYQSFHCESDLPNFDEVNKKLY
jgi:hypothetical protein